MKCLEHYVLDFRLFFSPRVQNIWYLGGGDPSLNAKFIHVTFKIIWGHESEFDGVEFLCAGSVVSVLQMFCILECSKCFVF